MTVPFRLVIPAHRVSVLQSDGYQLWCAENLEHAVSGKAEGNLYFLHFEDWKDAAAFQRKWLSD